MAEKLIGVKVRRPRARTAVKLVFEGVAGRIKRIRLANPDHQVVRMGLNSQILWVANIDEPFWIVFEDRTPFDRHAIDPTEVGIPQRPLRHGAFKYTVVLHADRTVRLDPVIVVDPPPWP